MKSILLPLTAHIQAAPLTKVASNLALQFRSSLTGLFIRPDPRSAIPFMGEGLTADMIQTLCDNAEKQGKQEADKAESEFRATIDKQGLKWLAEGDASDSAKASWTVLTGEVSDHVGRRARTADIAVCLQPDSDSPDSEDIFHDLIFRSGRSVLMVPGSFDGTVGKHLMIAWNGRAEGARAVAGALPMLRDAQKVTIVQVGDIGEDRPCAGAIAHYLAEHAVKAETKHADAGSSSVGECLLETADTIGADTIVLGAYSHSRWREMVLGGVTKHITAKSQLPVFMSH
ncbi:MULTISPECIES: universal stress protein [Kordiimonas]|jgi:nucleotide-binding universal stress UspA family protein|uniref:universal stress protein n=1 Tax=Kordiimonas TaxID=288021 RepID=UPI00257C50DD|nr:universal stress protein [Kordiimonas sp. UBA4487]